MVRKDAWNDFYKIVSLDDGLYVGEGAWGSKSGDPGYKSLPEGSV